MSANNAPDAERQIQEWWGQAKALYEQGKAEQAIGVYRQILQLIPNHPEVLNAIGNALVDLDRNHEALAAFNQAIKQEPAYVTAYVSMGHLFSLMKQFDKAALCYQQALQFAPHDAAIERSLAKMLAASNQWREALPYYESLRAKAPDDPMLAREILNLSPVVFEDDAAIDAWRDDFLQRLEAQPSADISAHMVECEQSNTKLNFDVLYHGRDNRILKERYYQRFTVLDAPQFLPSTRKQLRVGFHVDQFREGVFMRVMGQILAQWPAADITPVLLCPAAITHKLMAKIDNPKVECIALPQGLRESAAAIRVGDLDLVYFWEVGSTLATSFLPLLRVAPVQVTGWGSVETTGMRQIDCFLSSRLQEDGNTQDLYTEKLELLASLPAMYEKQTAIGTQDMRSAMGLPKNALVYFCPQAFSKLHPDFDHAVAEILKRDTNGVFIFVAPKTTSVAQALLARIKRHVGVAAERVVMIGFLDAANYMALLAQADCVLDTFYYCGGQTTLDAISVGAPVVTLPERSMKSRSTTACYEAIGVTQTIAASKEDYIEKALHIAQDSALRQRLREAVMAANAPLFDNGASAEEHAVFFRSIIARYREAGH